MLGGGLGVALWEATLIPRGLLGFPQSQVGITYVLLHTCYNYLQHKHYSSDTNEVTALQFSIAMNTAKVKFCIFFSLTSISQNKTFSHILLLRLHYLFHICLVVYQINVLYFIFYSPIVVCILFVQFQQHFTDYFLLLFFSLFLDKPLRTYRQALIKPSGFLL